MIQYRQIFWMNDYPTYVIADIHGDFDQFLRQVKERFYGCNLIVCGDIGLGFLSTDKTIETLNHINNVLASIAVTCYMIRGNHDDPSWFDGTHDNYSHINLVRDYDLLRTANDEYILCIGGAVSVDRSERIKKYNERVKFRIDRLGDTEDEARAAVTQTYWVNEGIVYSKDIIEQAIGDTKISYVITHTSPTFAFPTNKTHIAYWLERDDKLLDDLNEERHILSEVFDYLTENGHNIKKWIYGHFHSHASEKINDTTFIALANADYHIDIAEL